MSRLKFFLLNISVLFSFLVENGRAVPNSIISVSSDRTEDLKLSQGTLRCRVRGLGFTDGLGGGRLPERPWRRTAQTSRAARWSTVCCMCQVQAPARCAFVTTVSPCGVGRSTVIRHITANGSELANGAVNLSVWMIFFLLALETWKTPAQQLSAITFC
ncbi:uncharacterized protein LOC126281359 isoform X1 [Schistocerca gregaria]|uniref:uncharacterized protein LOC126281359 isoform X1 n=1 Tax=Schistocerca gregaria TaxID=7010 RepID=UPI00211F1CD7|nr:uncharacterized protein LOC126281359 isoform X1 [Schistocerca gregaria]